MYKRLRIPNEPGRQGDDGKTEMRSVQTLCVRVCITFLRHFRIRCPVGEIKQACMHGYEIESGTLTNPNSKALV